MLQQLALTCCRDGDDELAALQAAMEQRHRQRGSNPDTIKHLRQAFAAAREIGIRTRADLEDGAVDRRFAEGIGSLTRADGRPRWTDATQDLLRRHFRASIRHAAEQGRLRPPPDLERLASPGGRKWREAHPPTARTRRPSPARVRCLEDHVEQNDETWSGLRIYALVMLQEETGMLLASALRLTPQHVDRAFYRRIRYSPRRGRERYAPVSVRLERVLRRWLDHCGPYYLFPNQTRWAPWDEVSARRALGAQCLAAGLEPITFEQLQLCCARHDPEDAGAGAPAGVDEQAGESGPGSGAGSDIDFDGLAEALLRQGHRLASRLVRLMKDRMAASFEDVMDKVSEGRRAESSIRAMVNRTNNALFDLEPRLSFTTPDRQVLRHIKPRSAPLAGSGDATPMQRDVVPVQRPCNAK
jgi:integrase